MLAALKHKTPAVKSESASFLARCFCQCPPLLLTNKKVYSRRSISQQSLLTLLGGHYFEI